MYFTLGGAPVAAQDPANKTLIDAFTKAFPQDDDLGFGSFTGYDCTLLTTQVSSRSLLVLANAAAHVEFHVRAVAARATPDGADPRLR